MSVNEFKSTSRDPAAAVQRAGGESESVDIAQLLQKIDYLEAASRSVAHDLRNPLCAVDGLVRLLLDAHEGALTSEVREYIVCIGRAVGELSAMLDGLRSLSNTAVDPLNVVTVDLTQIARGIATHLARRHAHGVKFVVAPIPEVRSDRRLLTIAMHNLLSNAWTFTARSPAATVEVGGATDKAGNVTCFVRDNGVGFSPQAAEKIFLPFKRLNSARSFGGSGIGLATVKRIFDHLGGRVWAQGSPGEGATFYFTLPAQRGQAN